MAPKTRNVKKTSPVFVPRKFVFDPPPSGCKDANRFDIQIGVAVTSTIDKNLLKKGHFREVQKYKKTMMEKIARWATLEIHDMLNANNMGLSTEKLNFISKKDIVVTKI